jgi:hypothetical protein
MVPAPSALCAGVMPSLCAAFMGRSVSPEGVAVQVNVLRSSVLFWFSLLRVLKQLAVERISLLYLLLLGMGISG